MSKLLPVAIDFQSDARKIDERRPPWLARGTLYGLVAVIVIAVTFAAVTKIDQIVVAQGKLVTTAATMVVQPLETSVVRSLSARVGDIVRKGETLATLDPTFSEADADQLRGKIKSLAAQIERLEAEINDTSYEPRARDDEARLQAMIWTRSIEQNKAKLASFDQQVRHVMLWRTSSARSRRAPPAGFIRPCQPFLVVRPPADPDWLHEVKHDGYRIVARKQGESVSLWSRHGADFTDRLPAIAEAIGKLPADSALIDGEAVVFRPDGRSDFGALRTKPGGARPASSPSTS